MVDDPRTLPFRGQIHLNAEITAAISEASRAAAERTSRDLLTAMHDLIDPDTRAFWLTVNPNTATLDNTLRFRPALAGRWQLAGLALIPLPGAANAVSWPASVDITGIHGYEVVRLNQSYPNPPIQEITENSVEWLIVNNDTTLPAKLEITMKRLWIEPHVLGSGK